MRQSPLSKVNMLSVRTRWLLVSATTGAYVIIFVVLSPTTGDGIAALATVPSILAAWFFGMRRGIGAALILVLINALLFKIIGNSWDEVVGYSFGPGTFALLIVTLVVGRMHDAGKLLGEELAKRKQVEEALRESEERARQFADAALEAIVIHDKGIIVEVNRAFCSMYRFERSDVLGTSAIELTAPVSRELVREKIATGDIRPYEGLALRKDGTTFPAEVTGRPLTYHGRLMRSVVIRDLTLQKQAEAQRLELAVAQKRAEILQEFLNTVTHDFKTPLSIINAAIYLLDKSDDSETRAAKVQAIKVQTDLLGKYIEDMLTISRLEVLPELTMKRLDVNRLVSDVEVGFRALAESKKLTVRLDLANQPLLVFGDEQILNRALANLIENALTYTAQGGAITVDTTAQGDDVLIEISDTGIGISEADLPYIFERFYRADKARSAHTGGTGLGLAIVKKIVEIHNGSIEATSTLGIGSTFRIRLPGHKPE